MSKYWKVLFLLFPLLVYGMGAVSNQLVERFNSGRMPVEVPAGFQSTFPAGTIIDDNHVAAGSDTLFRKLDDRILMVGEIESIGDILLDVGSVLSLVFLGVAGLYTAVNNDSKNKKTLSLQ